VLAPDEECNMTCMFCSASPLRSDDMTETGGRAAGEGAQRAMSIQSTAC
jgi:hypothetical protein